MRSVLNYDHLNAMFNRSRILFPSLTFADFINRAGYTSSGEHAVLEMLHVLDGNSASIFLPLGLPYRSVIRLPESLPEFSIERLPETVLAISIRAGLLAAAPSMEAGSSRIVILGTQPLVKVRQTLLASADVRNLLSPYMGHPSPEAKCAYYIGLASKPSPSSSTTTAPVSSPLESRQPSRRISTWRRWFGTRIGTAGTANSAGAGGKGPRSTR